MHQSILSRRRARFNKLRKANLRSFRSLGIEQAIMRTSQDERVCEKCRSLHNRAINVRSAIRDTPLSGSSCTEGYCRCTYEPIIPEARSRPEQRMPR